VPLDDDTTARRSAPDARSYLRRAFRDEPAGNASALVSAGVALAPGGEARATAPREEGHVAMSSVNQEQSDIARLVAASTTGESVGRLWTSNDLRSAIRGQNLDIAYQPVLNLRTGRIVALEAFARWTTPTGSAISPDVFIPMAEESGLIGELGAQILRKATRAAARWQSIAPTGVRVNVSAPEVQAASFYDDVMRTLAHADLDPRLLGLEMNEPALFNEGTESATTLARLRAAGITLLLDDFGAGYSSLGSTQMIPVIDVLKVDRSLLSGDEDDQRTLETIVDLARARNVEISAEGVENATQHSLVVGSGCNYAQGYFFARPILGALVPKMLGSWAPFLPA
jgi:EAL domain-containing protein (putative c-di-GMP-specific phosphodiesterase class I)